MLLFMDGFDHYTGSTAGTGAALKWTGSVSGTRAMGTGRIGGQCIILGATSGTGFIRSASLRTASGGSVYMGVAFKVDVLSTRDLVAFLPTNSGVTIKIHLSSAGVLTVTNVNGGSYSTYSGPTIATGTWYYLEMSFPYSSSVAASGLNVYINGTSVIHNTGTVNTTTSGTIGWEFQLGDGVNNGVAYYDDFYVADDTTPGLAALTGPARIVTLYPAGAGVSTQWTPHTGANYAQVNEAQEDSDTSYVSTAGIGNRDSYTLGAMATTPVTVFGVQLVGTERTDASESVRTTNLAIRSAGTIYDGSIQSITGGAYKMCTQIWETDPATGVAWLPAAVNAMEAGVKLVS